MEKTRCCCHCCLLRLSNLEYMFLCLQLIFVDRSCQERPSRLPSFYLEVICEGILDIPILIANDFGNIRSTIECRITSSFTSQDKTMVSGKPDYC